MNGDRKRRRVFIDKYLKEEKDEESLEKSFQYDKAVQNRIARATGHLRSVKNMVEDGRDCSEVLIQLAAVKAEINNTSNTILKQYMSYVAVEAVKYDNREKILRLNQKLDLFLK